jgi:hypothetical protein
VGDPDGDGTPDLAVSNSNGAGPVTVLLNNGDGVGIVDFLQLIANWGLCP